MGNRDRAQFPDEMQLMTASNLIRSVWFTLVMVFSLISFLVVASKLYGVNATIIIFVFVLYCIVPFQETSLLTWKGSVIQTYYRLSGVWTQGQFGSLA